MGLEVLLSIQNESGIFIGTEEFQMNNPQYNPLTKKHYYAP